MIKLDKNKKQKSKEQKQKTKTSWKHTAIWSTNLIHVYALLQLLNICAYIYMCAYIYIYKNLMYWQKISCFIALQRLWIKYLILDVEITFAKLFHWPFSIVMLAHTRCISTAKNRMKNIIYQSLKENIVDLYSIFWVGATQNRHQGPKHRIGSYHESLKLHMPCVWNGEWQMMI